MYLLDSRRSRGTLWSSLARPRFSKHNSRDNEPTLSYDFQDLAINESRRAFQRHLTRTITTVTENRRTIRQTLSYVVNEKVNKSEMEEDGAVSSTFSFVSSLS